MQQRSPAFTLPAKPTYHKADIAAAVANYNHLFTTCSILGFVLPAELHMDPTGA